MLMRPLDFHSFGWARYDVMTLTTKDVVLFLRWFLFCFILNDTAWCFITLVFGRQAKQVVEAIIYGYHPLPFGVMQSQGITVYETDRYNLLWLWIV